MITPLVVKIIDRIGTDAPGVYWLGTALAFLLDMLLLGLLVYWLRTL